MRKTRLESKRSADQTAVWIAAGLTLLAFGLRLFHIDADSIWWDEGISLHLARGTWRALILDRSTNLHPPLYFLLLKAWVRLAGDSVFSARFFSLLGGLPGVALAYDVARRNWGRCAGLMSGAVTAAAATFVPYAQEVRVYAWLPGLTLLALAVGERLERRPERRRLWTALALVEAASLLLHYLSAITLLYVNLRLAVSLWRQRHAVWRAWLVSQAGAIALTAPWLMLVLAHRTEVSGQFALGSSLSIDPLPLPGVLRLVWTFLMTGHDRARYVEPLPTLAIALGIGLLLGTAYLAAARPADRRKLARTTLDWLLPVAVATLLWKLRPLSHPRYTLLWAGTLWVWIGVVLARLMALRGWPPRVAGGAGLLLALVLSGLSIRTYLFDPFFHKQDVRGVAALLRARAQPGDVALVPWQDQSLPYYDTGPVRVSMIDFRDPDAAWMALESATSDAGHVFVMEYDHATRDPIGMTTYALERAGALEQVISLLGLNLFIYRIDGPFESPELQTTSLEFDRLELTGFRADPAPADEAVTVALAWKGDVTAGPLKATVQLRDSLGNTVALSDHVLYDPQRRTSDRWPAGTQIINTYVLPLPQGTPPVTYEVAVAVYPADETAPGTLQSITRVTLTPSVRASSDPYRVGDLGLDSSIGGELAPGLSLTGALYSPRDARPGEAVDVILRWEAATPLPDLEPALRLDLDGRGLLDLPLPPADGQYPTSRWSPGEVVLDRRRLVLPPDVPPGALDFSVGLGAKAVWLGNVFVIGGSTFEAPAPQHRTDFLFGDIARLVGFDLSGDANSEAGLRVTLYWQALKPMDLDYTVFTQLIDSSGTVAGQHDFPPVGGVRPTSGWQAGEFLVDVHDIRLNAGVTPAPGAARLLVGLYDPETLGRLPLSNGEDAAMLETPLTFP